jgi:hypothetical protein
MPDLHELLAAELRRGGPVSAPPFETLVARSRQRRVKQALAVATAAVAVTAAIAVPSIVSRGGSAVVTGPAITTTNAARRAAAQEVVNQMVADVNLPVGASPLATAPAPLASESATEDSVVAERFFTVAGTMDSVIAYISAHPPTGLFVNGTTTETTGTGSSGTVETRGVDFAGAETSSYEAPELSVDVVLQGVSVAVRVSAHATLRPLRTIAEQVPANAAAVTVTFRQSDGVTDIDSWESPQAQVLAGALNALYTQGPDMTDTGCATSTPIYTVTFEVSHQPVVFSDYGCGSIAVTAAGVAQPALETGSVESRLYSMLGLQPPPQSSAPAAGTPPAPGASSPAP